MVCQMEKEGEKNKRMLCCFCILLSNIFINSPYGSEGKKKRGRNGEEFVMSIPLIVSHSVRILPRLPNIKNRR
jgi:hypothetical protein